jgi:hypothetical protein
VSFDHLKTRLEGDDGMSQHTVTTDARTLRVPGAMLYYEVRGSGPVLLLISGGPVDAGVSGDDGADGGKLQPVHRPRDPAVRAYVPDVDTLRNTSTRIVSAAGEDSGEQAARRAALALADRLGIPVTYLPGSHGGWGADPQEFAGSVHNVLQEP